MIRGIFFRALPGKNILWQIFKCIDVEKYSWHNILSQNEVLANYSGGIFFDADYYDGKTFLQNIISEYFIIFLKLQAYFEGGKFYDIHTCEEFLKSDCQLILFVYDCEYVEIYAKDEKDIKAIYENVLTLNYTEVKYITESNYSRTKMDIL